MSRPSASRPFALRHYSEGQCAEEPITSRPRVALSPIACLEGSIHLIGPAGCVGADQHEEPHGARKVSELIMKTVKAILGTDGRLRLPAKTKLSHAQRVLVTFLDDTPDLSESMLASQLSEPALAIEWDRPEEDEAWQHLQFDPS